MCYHYTIPASPGAGNGARTRHLSLGKAALYQMSYSRKTPCAPQDAQGLVAGEET